MGVSSDSHPNTLVTTIVVETIGVDVTYLGHGPSLENVEPVETAESLGPIPTGFCLEYTCPTGNKALVTAVTKKVGAFMAFGRDYVAITYNVPVEVKETGPLSTAKVVVGGGGCGTCTAECADISSELA